MVHLVTHSVQGDDPPGEASKSTIGTPSESVEGVPTEKVDSYTLQVIEQIFRRPANGVQFLALLLRFATIKQMAFGEAGEPREVAAITVQSIRVLARRIGWSYDTTQKYILTFCALGLLIKRRHRNQIELYFPLERYHLSTLQQLDSIIAKARPKVVSFAKKIRCRCLILLRESTNTGEQRPLTTQVQAIPPERLPESTILLHLPTALDSMRMFLESTEVDSETRHYLLQGIEHIFTQSALQNERLSSSLGDSPHSCQGAESRLSQQMGDSQPVSHITESRLAQQMVDSQLPPSMRQSRLSQQEVDSQPGMHTHHGRLSAKESTQKSPTDTQIGRLSGLSVDSQPKVGDSEADAPANVNVSITHILDTLNVNVKGVIKYLRQAFNEPPGKQGYYYKLYKQYAHADAWLAATIETLVGMHQMQSVQDAGRYFFSRCAAHHKEGIPPETAALVERYGGLTYTQLLEQLRTPAPPKPAQQHPTTKPAPVRPSLVCHLPRQRHHPGMSEQELHELLRTIQYHERTCYFPAQPYRQADGTCALLVSDGMGHQLWVYSLHEWRQRLERLDRTGKVPALFADPTDSRSS